MVALDYGYANAGNKYARDLPVGVDLVVLLLGSNSRELTNDEVAGRYIVLL